jgi:hypothetical protein
MINQRRRRFEPAAVEVAECRHAGQPRHAAVEALGEEALVPGPQRRVRHNRARRDHLASQSSTRIENAIFK